MPKRPSYRTRNALIKALRKAATDAPSALSVRLDGTTYVIDAGEAYVGTVAGKEYGALLLDADTMLFALDQRTGAHTARLLGEADADALGKIAADLLPAPEEPEEVKALREQLAGIKVPKGYRIVLDAKGKPTIVEHTDGASTQEPVEDGRHANRQTAGGGSEVGNLRPSQEKKQPKPAVEVGREFKGRRGKQAGKTYKIASLDRNTGYAVFVNPLDKDDDVREKVIGSNGKTPPAFWARWEVADGSESSAGG